MFNSANLVLLPSKDLETEKVEFYRSDNKNLDNYSIGSYILVKTQIKYMPNLCFKESPFSKIKFVPHKFCFCTIQLKGRFIFIKFPFCQGKPTSAHAHMLILSLVPSLFLFSKFMISASYIFHQVIFKTVENDASIYSLP